jgi:hypothetical protein
MFFCIFTFKQLYFINQLELDACFYEILFLIMTNDIPSQTTDIDSWPTMH